WLVWCGTAGAGEPVTIVDAVPQTSIRGRSSADGVVLDFTVTVDPTTGARSLEFRERGTVVASFSSDERGLAVALRVAGVAWSDDRPLAGAARDRVRAFAESPAAAPIRELAIQLPPVLPGAEYKTLRLAILQAYAEIARSGGRRRADFS